MDHLPYEWLLNFAKDKLKKGGKLIILDLVKAKSLSDHIIWGSAFFPNIIMNSIKMVKLEKMMKMLGKFGKDMASMIHI